MFIHFFHLKTACHFTSPNTDDIKIQSLTKQNQPSPTKVLNMMGDHTNKRDSEKETRLKS